MRYKIVDDFDTNIERFWEVVFDEAYNQALFSHLRIRRQLVKMDRRPDGSLSYVHRLTPLIEPPAVIQAVLDGPITYEEKLEFDSTQNSAKVVTKPNYLAKDVLNWGTFSAREEGGKVVRTWAGRCSCYIPFVGDRIVKHIVKEVRTSYAKTTVFTRKWLRATDRA